MIDRPLPGDIVVYGTRDKNHNGKRDPGEIGHCAIVVSVPGVSAVPGINEAVDEALLWVGKGKYKMGRGGRRPEDGTPLDENGYCDCSGFVCHCLGIDRLENNQWWNTDSIRKDGLKDGGRFVPVNMNGYDLAKCRVVHCQSRGKYAVVNTTGLIFKNRGAVVARLVPAEARDLTAGTRVITLKS